MGEITVLAGVIGAGKTYLALEIVRMAKRYGIRGKYLPLEDSAESALRRILAIDQCDWAIMRENQFEAQKRIDTIKSNIETAKFFGGGICRNPRKVTADERGRMVVPPLPWKSVVEWLESEAFAGGMIIVDPITMIDFKSADNPYKKSWECQQDFIKSAVATAAGKHCHIVLVAHLVKDNRRDGRPLTLSDVEGSTGITRFCHNVLLLDLHEERTHTVFSTAGQIEMEITHKRTLTIAKSRGGPGTGARMAVDFHKDGPVLMEHGIIRAKK